MEEENSSTPPIWQAENNYPDQCSQLREGFKEVTDPELGLNIIQLGLIRDVIITAEKVHIVMILTTPFCPYGPAMLERSREKAETVLNKTATIEFALDPWDFSMMEDGLAQDWGLW
jgi:metal-sulfur cluster biosynthetic enzyme